MLDQLTGLVKNQAMDYLKGSGDDLSEEQMGQVADVAQESVTDGLKQEVMSGNISGLQSLFTGGADGIAGHPIVQKIINMFGGSLVSKIGLGSGIASGISAGMVPGLMKSLGGKFQSSDAADSGFDISNIAGMMGGGGLADMAKNALGGADGGGVVDMAKDALGGVADKADDVGGMFK